MSACFVRNDSGGRGGASMSELKLRPPKEGVVLQAVIWCPALELGAIILALLAAIDTRGQGRIPFATNGFPDRAPMKNRLLAAAIVAATIAIAASLLAGGRLSPLLPSGQNSP